MKLRLLIAAILMMAAGLSIRRAAADAYSRSGDFDRASWLEPANPEYLLRRVEHPSDSELKRALMLEPRRATVWIELGVRAELDGDFTLAEKHHRQATAVSRQYDTLWALAAYYFRRGDHSSFLPAARLAAAMAYGNDGQLFELCDRVLRKPADVLGQCLTTDPALVRRYLRYLLRSGRHFDATPVAIQLAAAGRQTDRDDLLDLSDVLLTAGQRDAAMRLWNAAARGGVITHRPVHDAEPGLMNGEFTAPILQRGFDWRLADAAGVRMFADRSRRELRVVLDGNQPDEFTVLSQLVPVRGSMVLKLTHAPLPRELTWRFFGEPGGREIESHSGVDGASITTARATGMIRVALTYRRKLNARFEGTVHVRELALRRLSGEK